MSHHYNNSTFTVVNEATPGMSTACAQYRRVITNLPFKQTHGSFKRMEDTSSPSQLVTASRSGLLPTSMVFAVLRRVWSGMFRASRHSYVCLLHRLIFLSSNRRPPPDQPYSNGVWAPQLHDLNGRWYIYFAAAHPARGNPSHRMWVLGGGPSDQDPLEPSQWQFLGGIKGMP